MNQVSNHILIVEDEGDLRRLMVEAVTSMGYRVTAACDGVEAINLVNCTLFDVVLLDIQMPRVDGLDVLQHIKDHSPSTEVIMLTGVSDVRIAVKAMKIGASDYLTKPAQYDELEIILSKTLKQKSLRTSSLILQRNMERTDSRSAVIGQSEGWNATLEKARRFANSDLLVHIEGESGTGKEVLANYIHSVSDRKEKPFVVIDCGVIHASLIESELFGHVKGAFTGAETGKEGLVEMAQGGTLFIDEIGHIDLMFQQKLLKFVETKSYRRVGDTVTRTVDVRIITATNKNLADETKSGRFRSDLWYRLNVMKLEILPLRLRKADIIPLAKYFLQKYYRNPGEKNFTSQAIALLERYSWPGNVRELQSTIQRALALSDDDNITPEDLSIEPNISISYPVSSLESKQMQENLVSLAENEKNHISFVLQSVDWNISQAAKVLQIGRNTLYSKMKEFELEPPAK